MASANREGRRRRVLREDSQSVDAGSKSRSRKKAKAYSDAALIELQPRITDLIPTRISGLVLLLLLGIASAAVVQTVYHIRVNRLSHVDYQVVSGMNLYGPGTIISWMSSVYLLMAGAAALLVYNTRRHKIDDYFGRYGLWIWMAAACLLASLDATTGLHRVAQYALMQTTGTAMWGDGSIWWIAAYAVVALVVGGRALVDMWPCRGAFFLVLAAGCYALATTIYLGIYRPNLGPHNMTLHSSTMLLGHFFVLYSFLVYARYIHRVAQGLVGKKSSSKQQVGWWARQQDRLAQARKERVAARMLRAEAKAEEAAAREAAKEQKAIDRQATKAKQVAEREAAKAKKTAAREAAKAEARDKKVAAREKAAAKQAAAKQESGRAAKQQQAATPKAKRSSPIDVQSVRAKKSASKPAAGKVSHDDDTADMTVEELEMELLTNPNLSKAERRKLRKQLKDQQSRQRQAA